MFNGLALVPGGVLAQQFGKNKVQYETFDWKVLATEHLEIYFYPEESALAERAAEYGEAACRDLDSQLGHKLTKRIPLIVYKSHYHFRQNNVTPARVGESTGGFTEIFRNRVVLPYTGSEPAFRHVIHHELVHAYVFDKLYGGPVRSLFALQYSFHIPLWFMEGIAEYYSNRWDSEAEMMIRDAALRENLPPFHEIQGGYFVYKSGWSAVGYLVKRFGDDVIPRILEDLDKTRVLEESLATVTGEDLAKIGAGWLKEVKKRTWPTVSYLNEPGALGCPLEATSPEGSLDLHPSLSPSGKRIAFLSTRSGTPDLWITGSDAERPPWVLVRGSRGGKFESLHPFRSSVGWSPDEKMLVVAAQKGARDALYVFDVESRRVLAEHAPELDSIERPDWSPRNAQFVFTGMKDGQVDLWVMDADGSSLRRLTNDLFEERGPRFSPDGEEIAYASDHGSLELDLFSVHVETGAVRTLRVAPGNQWDPCWASDGKLVYHVSDEHGTRDLMVVSEHGDEAKRLSALVGGVDSPSCARESKRLAFTAYHAGRSSVFVVEDADTLSAVEAPKVLFESSPWSEETPDSSASAPAPVASLEPRTAADPGAVEGYRPRFRTEWITGAVGYGGRGASGAVQATITDILGNHRLFVGTQVYRSLRDSDFIAAYSYLPSRFDYQLSLFHMRDFFFSSRTSLGQPIGEEGDRAFFSERQWGFLVSAAYPFHTFRRVSLEVGFVDQERIRYTGESRELGEELEEIGSSRSKLLTPRLHHTFDNTLSALSGPVQGTRYFLSLQHAVAIGGDRLSYTTALLDLRRYFQFDRHYVLALRGMAAASFGPNPQVFQLGGPNTIRGFPLQEFHGRNAGLLSIEFRYPFLEYVRFGWPLRSAFGGVRGNIFVDAGAAFEDASSFRFTDESGEGNTALEDLKVGFGVGFRARIAFLPVRVDVGWPTDFARAGSPTWHFSIGPEY